jgi:hypothetical protein
MNDMEAQVPLGGLDPAGGEPDYWVRYQERVLAHVRPELARRRTMEASIPLLLVSWGRKVVPMALLAAGMAGILLLSGGGDAEVATLWAVEDILQEEVRRMASDPLFLELDPAREELFHFAVEVAVSEGTP